MRSDSTLGKSWGAKGKTPEVSCFAGGSRQAVNAISAVNAKGGFLYATYQGRLTAPKFVEFLRHFLRGRKKPVMLVLDGHPAHRAKLVKKFVQSLKGRLELHFLPPYAPDLNPDEFVWSHVRRTGLSKTPLRKGESLKARVVADLERIKRRPALVRSFFGGRGGRGGRSHKDRQQAGSRGSPRQSTSKQASKQASEQAPESERGEPLDSPRRVSS